MDKKMKIAFCGLGSIGSRHLRNLVQVLGQRGYTAEIDWIQHTTGKVPAGFENIIGHTYRYDGELPADFDVIFITNPTYRHRETIETMQWHTRALFIEKPLFAFPGEKLGEVNPGCLYYVACPVRYKRVIQYIKETVNREDVLAASAVCSSYLPEWRPGTDYRKGYSAIQGQGGGVSLDLIHELDYLSYLLGDIREIYNIRGKISPLEIDSDDVSVYIARAGNAVIQVYLDYFGRADIRRLMLFTKEDTLEADLLHNSVRFLKAGRTVEFQETRDDFQKRELDCFLDVLEGKAANPNDLEQAEKLFYNTFGRIK